jgi:hypothetical protein
MESSREYYLILHLQHLFYELHFLSFVSLTTATVADNVLIILDAVKQAE